MRKPSWKQRLAKNIKDLAGETKMREVMKSCEGLTSQKGKARWTKKAMEKLDQLVSSKTKRCEIMAKSSCVFYQRRIVVLRAKYKKLKDIDRLLEHMHKDPYYAKPQRKGKTIYITKVPYDPKKFQRAKTKREKRLSYCHCSYVRATRGKISPTFCYCGSGWYKKIWEGILEKPVMVVVLKSILQGDDCCRFAIRI